jgi:putative colanic acid biosynthesis UDP-glucose lipid carrier transferase
LRSSPGTIARLVLFGHNEFYFQRGFALSNGLIRAHTPKIMVVQRLMDMLLVVGSFFITSWFYDIPVGKYHFEFAVISALCFYVVGQARGIYGSWRINTITSEIVEIITVWILAFALVLVVAYVTKTSATFSRRVVLTWLLACPSILVVSRLSVRMLLHELRSRGRNTRSVAIVGTNRAAHQLVRQIDAMPWAGLVFKGYYDDPPVEPSLSELPPGLSGDVSELLAQARAGKIDAIYIALPMHEEQRIIDLLNRFSDTTASVYFLPDSFIFELMNARWISLNGMPIISIHETPFYGVDGWVKRMEDLVLGAVILAVIALPMLLIALAVKLTSPGPVLFKQRRYGLNGEVVSIWKFRSMTVCEDGADIPQAKRGDARITPLGVFLRKTSLDELPQFINVLQGSMSVVGPRPHAVAHNEEYRRLIHGYMLRHKVKPGITGWAQVNGWRGETDTLEKMQKRVDCDLHYIQNWSLWLDLKIVWMTIWQVLAGRNAY